MLFWAGSDALCYVPKVAGQQKGDGVQQQHSRNFNQRSVERFLYGREGKGAVEALPGDACYNRGAPLFF